MTPDQQSVVLSLTLAQGRAEPLRKEEFLREFGASDGVALGLDLLRHATEQNDPVDVELSLIVCFVFGINTDHLEVLLTLAYADWHERHEDIVRALQMTGFTAIVDAMEHLATWTPDYPPFDGGRALARKAIHVLSAIWNEEARDALNRLKESDRDFVVEYARAQLER